MNAVNEELSDQLDALGVTNADQLRKFLSGVVSEYMMQRLEAGADRNNTILGVYAALEATKLNLHAHAEANESRTADED